MMQSLTAIVPCTDLDTSEAFYGRLGFGRPALGKPAPGLPDDYRILSGRGGSLHLTPAPEGWLEPGRNPFGLYLLRDDVDALAASLADLRIDGRGPEAKTWGMYEFAVRDPDGTLVRIGWPTRLPR